MTIFVCSIWSLTASFAYNTSIESGHTFEESITVAFLTFPLYVILFALYAIYSISPAFMWDEIFTKTANNEDFDFFDIMFMFGQIFDD